MGGQLGFRLVLALLATPSMPALAGEATIQVGAATILFDDARWTAVPTAPGAALFLPRGEAAKKLDPVAFRAEPALEALPCSGVAEAQFRIGPYDTSDVSRAPITIGGVAGERFAAHTRCRNATPRGEVACVRVEGVAYTVAALHTGCGGRNLFSGLDPIEEIGRGVGFAAVAP